jgi:hypothetical protein
MRCPSPWVEPLDISNAVLLLSFNEARYITGVTLPADAWFYAQMAMAAYAKQYWNI